MRATPPDHGQQAECRYDLGDPSRKLRAGVLRELQIGRSNMIWLEPYAEDGTDDLRGDVGRHGVPAQSSVAAAASVTTGFTWAPDCGPKARMSATSAPPWRSRSRAARARHSGEQALGHDARPDDGDQRMLSRPSFRECLVDKRAVSTLERPSRPTSRAPAPLM